MKVDFSTPNRILFGCGVIREIGQIAQPMGVRALVVRGMEASPAELIIHYLHQAGIESIPFSVNCEPTVSLIHEGVLFGRETRIDFVVGVGGGSVIDTGKAISALLTNPGSLMDYLEVIGEGKPLVNPGLPLIAIPTTAGTGSEATRNAVISVPERHVKVSLRSPLLIPQVALVDPELTLTLPKSITASTGMDALTQLIEPFVSKKANRMTDMLCRDGIANVALALKQAYMVPDDLRAREAMSWASLLSGLSLANAGLGAVHGFAGPIGGMFNAPHGAICARLLPAVVAANINLLKRHFPNHATLAKYHEISRLLTQNSDADLTDGIKWLKELCEFLSIPRLRAYNIHRGHLDDIVEKSLAASSMKGNPVELTSGELRKILEKSL